MSQTLRREAPLSAVPYYIYIFDSYGICRPSFTELPTSSIAKTSHVIVYWFPSRARNNRN